jgi:signal transduction histidine kinase
MEKNRRILVVDDNDAIHEDFRKILGGEVRESDALASARAAFFGSEESASAEQQFQLSFASQGLDGVELAKRAADRGEPIALAFIDVRMPPGIDGIQTIRRIWETDDCMQVVICTAFADYSFEEIIEELGSSDRLLILKKPFDPVEVRQLAAALTEKWHTAAITRLQVAELERAEREAREHAASLEVAFRALEEANQRIRSANRAKSEFLANMSHEIRTPMNAILGYADFLCDPAIAYEDRLEYGRIIRESGKHLLAILNDVLDISRIEAGRVEITSSRFSPTELSREVAELLRERAQEKGLQLVVEQHGEIPMTMCSDPVRVRQVLLNLVGNSVKFTESGTVSVSCGMAETAPAEVPHVRFEVTDTGIGIPADKLDSLFQAFTQLDTSSTRRAGGTGLGLAISKRLAEMLGGRIEVESESGRGSTFRLVLPLEQTEEVPEAPGATQRAEEERRAAGKPVAQSDTPLNARVLLVEDVKLNQKLIRTILQRSGAEVEVAGDGRQGVDLFLEEHAAGRPFDIVLMDMQMPVMDGYEATVELRRLGWTGPVIALTAHAMSSDRKKCMDAGCTDYTTKPIDKGHLIDLCHRTLAQPDPPPALPGRSGPGAGEAGGAVQSSETLAEQPGEDHGDRPA